MRVTSRSSGHGIVAAKSHPAGTSKQLVAPPPAGLPIAPSTPRKTDLQPSSSVVLALLGLPHQLPSPLPAQEPEPAWPSRAVHYTHSTLVYSASYNIRYPADCRRLLSSAYLVSHRVASTPTSSGYELKSLLDTTVGCSPAQDEAQLSSGGQAEGHLQPLCRQILGPLTGRGHTTVRSTFRLGTTPKSPETRPPAHPCTGDRQPPAWAIACF